MLDDGLEKLYLFSLLFKSYTRVRISEELCGIFFIIFFLNLFKKTSLLALC